MTNQSPNIYNMRKEKENLAYRNKRLYAWKQRITKMVTSIFLFVLILGLSFVILYPFFKLIPTIFNPLDNLGEPEVVWVPKEFSFESFKVASYLLFSDNLIMFKSLFYSLSIAVIQTFVCAMVGYSLARIDFRGRNIIFMLVIVSFIVPPQATLISQYLRFKDFDIFGIAGLLTGDSIDLINKPITLYILAIFGFGLKQSLFIFIFRQFFINIPKEIEEAALIDGCGFYRTYFKVMLPNAMPAIMTVLVFSFVWNYGDTYYVNYFNPQGSFLSTVLNNTFVDGNYNYIIKNIAWHKFDIRLFTQLTFDSIKQAALLIFIAPLLILYFIIQRRFVENFEQSGIVG